MKSSVWKTAIAASALVATSAWNAAIFAAPTHRGMPPWAARAAASAAAATQARPSHGLTI